MELRSIVTKENALRGSVTRKTVVYGVIVLCVVLRCEVNILADRRDPGVMKPKTTIAIIRL